MSLCHNWLGVLRSKNRGVPGFLGAFLFCGLVSCAVARVLCTVALLAGSRKNRLSISEILRLPKLGLDFFTSRILSLTRTDNGVLFRAALSFRNPSSPDCRYSFAHSFR